MLRPPIEPQIGRQSATLADAQTGEIAVIPAFNKFTKKTFTLEPMAAENIMALKPLADRHRQQMNASIIELGVQGIIRAADFGQFLQKETERWGKVLREANIRPPD